MRVSAVEVGVGVLGIEPHRGVVIDDRLLMLGIEGVGVGSIVVEFRRVSRSCYRFSEVFDRFFGMPFVDFTDAVLERVDDFLGRGA